MEDEDFQELIRLLAQQLREIGAGDIADDQHYTEVDPETGDRRVASPQIQLILMLQAFERFLAVRDHATYADSLTRLNENVHGEGPRSVVYEPTVGGRDVSPRDLGRCPDLGELRAEVLEFIDEIKERRDE